MAEYLDGPMANGSTPSQKVSGHDLLQISDVVQFVDFAWRNAMPIVLGVAIAAALGWMYCVNTPPVYESTAELLVEKRDPLDLAGMGPQLSSNQGELSMHVTLIRSPWFVKRVAKEHRLHALTSLAGSPDPAAALRRSLTVEHANKDDEGISDSVILSFSFRGSQPEECPVVLGAFLDDYQEFLDESDRSEDDDAWRLVTQKASAMQEELREKELDYEEFRKASPLLSNGSHESNELVERLAEIESKRLDLRVRRAEVESRLTAARAALLSGTIAPDAVAMVDDSREREDKLKELLLPLLVEEKRLLEDYGLGYPRLQAIQEEIELTRELFGSRSAAAAQGGRLVATGQERRNSLRAQQVIGSLEQELKGIAAAERQLTEQYNLERDQSKSLVLHELRDLRLRNDITRAERLHETLIAQLQGLDVRKDSGGYRTRVIAPPVLGKQVAPNVLFVCSLSVLIGLVGGFAAACWREVSDKTFRNPATIHRLGLPVLGQMPWMTPDRRARREAAASEVTPLLCTYHCPNSVEAESYRGLRTAIFFGTHGKPTKVVQITSPNPGDGKSTLAANLAVSMAQSGKRVLLIDGDLRRGELHQAFGLCNQEGLASVLSDEAEPNDAIQPSGLAQLSLLPRGPRPSNAADLLSSPRLRELLDALREEYDYILIDTPPLLAVADAQITAPLADGVLLAIGLKKKGRPFAERAKQTLEMLDANLLGLVVNGAKHTAYAAEKQYCEGISAAPCAR